MKNSRGFTLIELMIVVVIVAILAAIGYPSYQDQVRKTRRADCEGTLMAAAAALERYYTTNGSYSGATLGSSGVYPATCPPDSSGPTAYKLTLSVSSGGSGYTLTATPTSIQSGDGCGNLTLTQAGVKGTSKGSVAACW